MTSAFQNLLKRISVTSYRKKMKTICYDYFIPFDTGSSFISPFNHQRV